MRQRKCKDCGCDISNRFILAKRCVSCSLKRSYRMENRRRRAQRRAEKC